MDANERRQREENYAQWREDNPELAKLTPLSKPLERMPDGTSRSGLSQGVVSEIVRERAEALVAVERLQARVRELEAQIERQVDANARLFGRVVEERAVAAWNRAAQGEAERLARESREAGER